jgi:hypothetical protein
MNLDVSDLISFYDAPLGRIARQLVGARLGVLWPRVGGMRVLGLGYAGPYLQPFQEEAERVLAVAPAATGVTAWPGDGRQRVCLAAEDQLPLPDAAVDRVLLVHALEVAQDPERRRRSERVAPTAAASSTGSCPTRCSRPPPGTRRCSCRPGRGAS